MVGAGKGLSKFPHVGGRFHPCLSFLVFLGVVERLIRKGRTSNMIIAC